MLVLGIETSTPVSSIAIGSEQGLIASTMLARGRGHCEFLVPEIKHMCEITGVPMSSFAGIAVGLGPGLFTGMRVGVATAKTLAQSLGIPVVGIPSLDVLAFSVRYTSKVICACIDAKRGEVFSGFYRQVPGGIARLGVYQSWKPERLVAEIEYRRHDVLFVGNGALLYRDRLQGIGAEFASLENAFPRADALVELALPRLQREEFDSPLEIEPLYIRKSDAEINWERRGVAIARPARVQTSREASEAAAMRKRAREGNGETGRQEGEP